MKRNFTNKNGFTLVELLAVIAILGTIMIIATLSITSIRSKVLLSQKENTVNRIKVSAQQYFNDTGIKKVYVQTLIDQGYLEADGEKQIIEDPVTKDSMSCNLVTLEDGDVVVDTQNTECTQDYIKDALLKLKYCRGETCTPNFNVANIAGKWQKDTITLGIDASEIQMADKNFGGGYKTYWITSLNPSMAIENDKITIGKSDSSINMTYEVKVEYNDKTYNSSINIKIDKAKPTAHNIKVSDADNWAISKKITATLRDKGSGLQKYAITKTADAVPNKSEWININGSKDEYNLEYIAKENGKYYIWVMDYAGNSNSDTIEMSKINVDKVDNTGPRCVISGESTVWSNISRGILFTCEDDGIGCKPDQSKSYLFTETIKTKYLDDYVIEDRLGNKTTCQLYNDTGSKRQANIYLDKTAPLVTYKFISQSKLYNSKNFTLKLSVNDKHSGISLIRIFTSEGTMYEKVFDRQTNETFKFTDDIAFDLNIRQYSGQIPFIKIEVTDSVGNIYEDIPKEYRLYKYCTKTYIVNSMLTDICSKKCDGGYLYQQNEYNDLYFPDLYCYTNKKDINTSYPCNTQSCCSEGNWQYDYCSRKGYKVYSRYNECLRKWEEDERKNESCEGEDFNCYWTSCDKNGVTNEICSYYEGGVKHNYVATMEACEIELPDRDPEIKPPPPNLPPDPDPDPEIKPPPATPEPEPENLCEILDSSDAFGTSKGHHYGTPVNNYGLWYSNLSYEYECYNGNHCYRSNGYERVCYSSVCGKYQGMTAKAIESATGCDLSKWWCSCATEGEF